MKSDIVVHNWVIRSPPHNGWLVSWILKAIFACCEIKLKPVCDRTLSIVQIELFVRAKELRMYPESGSKHFRQLLQTGQGPH